MSLTTPDLTYDIRSFQRGFMDTPDAARLPREASAFAANGFFYFANGLSGECSFGKRQGARLVNPTAITAGSRVDLLYEFRREGVAAGELLAVCNGSLYKWDGAASFTLLDATGFGLNVPIEANTFRNLAFLMDGTTQQMYDGTSVLDIGFAAPTAAPALAAVAGPGVTGTYQTLAVWYDSTHDHESSPTDYGTPVVFTNQQRQHTKPTGSPPANVDKWRIYCRRTDTNEVYFKLVAETAVGTATATEALADSARNLASNLLAPLPNANDVPPVFAFMCNAQGYGFGVQLNSSFVHVSANGDLQSWHPKDVLGVARGDGQNVTTIRTVGDGTSASGTMIIAQKARKTYQLQGDRMPFVPKELNPGFGNHSQASAIDAVGRYWAWDDEKGPYSTDLQGTWTSLVDGRIENVIATVNLGAEIRACHVKKLGLICWIVAVGSSLRTRTMLAYNYVIGAWLPPITGIEYGALTTFQLSDGSVSFYVGDQWGRVYRYFTDDVEGPPSGTLTAPVTAASASTVTAASAAFYTAGDGLKGMPVAVVDAAGNWQWRTIQSNTGTQITIDTINGSVWGQTPDTTYTVVVGGIDWYWTTPLVDFEKPNLKKKGGYVYVELRAQTASFVLLVRGRLDDSASPASTSDTFLGPVNTGVWGSGLWGTMIWGTGNRRTGKQRISRCFYGVQFQFGNGYPNQRAQIITFGFGADWLPRRRG